MVVIVYEKHPNFCFRYGQIGYEETSFYLVLVAQYVEM